MLSTGQTIAKEAVDLKPIDRCTQPILPEYRFMPNNPLTLLNVCQAIRQTPQDALVPIDRETLLATRRALLALKAESTARFRGSRSWMSIS